MKRFTTAQDLCAEILKFDTPSLQEVDNGIGAYEYWGFKGVDIQLDAEVEELPEIVLELLIPEGYTLNMLHFDTFISDIISEVDDAVQEVELVAKRKATITADEYGKRDYSDIIKLCYCLAIHTHSCSTKIHKIVFTFNWEDGR